MADAYIVDAVRTPTGKRRGGLSEVHGADLGAHVLKRSWWKMSTTTGMSTMTT